MIRKAFLSFVSVTALSIATAAFALPDPPDAPPPPSSSGEATNQDAKGLLDGSEKRGGHARGRHVGKTGTQLKSRNIDKSTTFQSESDQNRAVKDMMNSTSGKQTRGRVGRGRTGNKEGVTTRHGGRTRPIGKVVEGKGRNAKEFNIRVDETTTVLKKGSGGGVDVLTSYPSKYTKLEKPSSGPSLKPTKRHNVRNVETGNGGLRRVPKQTDKPLQLDGQTDFSDVTKGAKGKVAPETQEGSETPKPMSRTQRRRANAKKKKAEQE